MSGIIKSSKENTNIDLVMAIEKKFGKISELCKQPEIVALNLRSAYRMTDNLIHLSKSPIGADGRFTKLAMAISEALDIRPEELFPLDQYQSVLPRGIKPVAFCALSDRKERHLPDKSCQSDPEEMTQQEILRARINKILKSLPYREREIIKLRFGIGSGYEYTLEEVGHIFKVTRERIRQIEAKAVRKLQQPSRSQELVKFLG